MTVATFAQSDYTTQSGTAYPLNIDGDIAVLASVAAQFAPHAAATPNLTVLVDAGEVFNGSAVTAVAQQTTAAFTAPASGQLRIDRVVLNASTGVLSVVAGTPVPSGPVPPAIPAGSVPCAQVALTSSTTAITNSLITDERALSALGLGSAASSPIGTSGSAVPLLDGANSWSGAQSFLDQGVVVGAPTGGNQGAGSLNAQALAVNGDAVPSVGGANTWTAQQTFNDPVAAAAASAAGHLIQLGQMTGHLAMPGYLKLPVWDGSQLRTFIFQWGSIFCGTANETTAGTLPLAFPTAPLSAMLTPGGGEIAALSTITTTEVLVTSGAAGATIFYLAWGY